jgi:cytochrome c5
MILLMFMSVLAFAEEPEDRSEKIYKSFCVNCHGERMEKVPLKPDSTTEQRINTVNDGVSSMPPYNWMLQDGEAERLVKYMEGIK